MKKTYNADNAVLFDIGEMQHVCSLIEECFEPSERTALAKSLNKLLLAPVEKILSKLDANAAEFDAVNNFIASIEYIAQALTSADTETAELSDILRDRWTAFIAHASAHRMYHDLPKTSKRQSKIASKPRKNKPTKAMLEKHREKFIYDKSKAGGKDSDRGWVKLACADFKISKDTIRRIRNAK
jgi:hypothetical protein